MVIVGVDEAGRGALFGRIYAGAVVLPDAFEIPIVQKKKDTVVIRDSKKMSALQRDRSRKYLETSTFFGIGWCDEKEIDEHGITHCNVQAMHRALDDLIKKHPDIMIDKIIVDGVLFKPYHGIPHQLVVRGDAEHMEIGAASVLAKTYRDEYITTLCDEDTLLDRYGIRSNKGYGTAVHTSALKKHGHHPFHRLTFIRNFQKQTLKFL